MKRILFSLSLFFLFSQALSAQEINLQECYDLALAHHPLVGKTPILQSLEQNRLDQIAGQRMPSLQWNAAASLQTETIDLPISFPGFEGLDLPLYRAQTTLEGRYNVLDGGITNARKSALAADYAVQRQTITVELEQLKPRINRYFFGILLLQQKDSILQLALRDLEQRKKTLEAAVREGVLLPAEVDRFEVEMIRLQARIRETEAERITALKGLSDLLGMELDPAVSLISEEVRLPPTTELNRPELTLFALQKERIQAGAALIDARDKPKLGVYLQAGVGVPNPLNFFENEVSPFAVGGVRFSWPLLDWGAKDRDRQQLILQSELVNNQQAIFEDRIDQELIALRGEIQKLEEQMTFDRQVLELQAKIQASVGTQLEQGVATSTDYLTEVTATTQAKLQLELHQLQLAQAKIQYLTLIGNNK